MKILELQNIRTICHQICIKVPFSHIKFDPFLNLKLHNFLFIACNYLKFFMINYLGGILFFAKATLSFLDTSDTKYCSNKDDAREQSIWNVTFNSNVQSLIQQLHFVQILDSTTEVKFYSSSDISKKKSSYITTKKEVSQ